MSEKKNYFLFPLGVEKLVRELNSLNPNYTYIEHSLRNSNKVQISQLYDSLIIKVEPQIIKVIIIFLSCFVLIYFCFSLMFSVVFLDKNVLQKILLQ